MPQQKEKVRPVHEIRLGRIKAAIWENETQNGTVFNVTLARLYRDGKQWKVVDPRSVLAKDDHVRFRFRSNFDGYLYVMNQSTSGKYETLFPRQDTGEQNRIQAGKEYVVPATQGWFRIAGPPGQDVLYWIVTPASLGSGYKYQPLRS